GPALSAQARRMGARAPARVLLSYHRPTASPSAANRRAGTLRPPGVAPRRSAPARRRPARDRLSLPMLLSLMLFPVLRVRGCLLSMILPRMIERGSSI
ncbi:MAG: hypothetical protein ACRDHG_15555, partial [Anaerolineales bacterium]